MALYDKMREILEGRSSVEKYRCWRCPQCGREVSRYGPSPDPLEEYCAGCQGDLQMIETELREFCEEENSNAL